jgi:hypothetical protein
MEHIEIIEAIKNHEDRLKKVEELLFNRSLDKVAPTSKKISISEFINLKRPKDDLQRTVLFAYFLEKNENNEHFNSEDIQNCFIKSKSAKPSNINDKINQCIKKGWLSEHSEKRNNKKAFYLTNTGIIAVEKNFKD